MFSRCSPDQSVCACARFATGGQGFCSANKRACVVTLQRKHAPQTKMHANARKLGPLGLGDLWPLLPAARRGRANKQTYSLVLHVNTHKSWVLGSWRRSLRVKFHGWVFGGDVCALHLYSATPTYSAACVVLPWALGGFCSDLCPLSFISNSDQ